MSKGMKPFQLRYEEEWMRRVDEWRRLHPNIPTRAEAIRQLVDIAVEIESKKRRPRS